MARLGAGNARWAVLAIAVLIVGALLWGALRDDGGDGSSGRARELAFGQEYTTDEDFRITVHGVERRGDQALVELTACAGAHPQAEPLSLDDLVSRVTLRLAGRERAELPLRGGVEPTLDKPEELRAGACRRGLLTFSAPTDARVEHVGWVRGLELRARWLAPSAG